MVTVLIATALGALLGTQREMLQQKWNVQEFGGIRSFMMLSLLGLLSTLLARSLGTWFVGVTGIGTTVFLAIGYVRKSFRSEHVGVTSELAGLLTFLIGVLTYYDTTLAVAIGVLVALIITLKDPLHRFVSKLSQDEFLSTVEFVLFAFVILPVLPNRAIDPWGLFNPYEFWVLILVVLGVSFTGYLATKLLGNRRGLLLTGILGGVVSSTAVTNAMSARSLKSPKLSHIISSATIAASAVMLVRVAVLLGFLSIPLLMEMRWPLLGMLVVTVIGLAWPLYQSWKKGKDDKDNEVAQRSPFSLPQALKMCGFLLVVITVSTFAREHFGNNGVYVTAFFTGLVDADAFILSMIHLNFQDRELLAPSAHAILIAVSANMVGKAGMAMVFGERSFGRRVARVLIASGLAGLMMAVLL